jgi:pyridoxine 4-dehydrogenase
VAKLDARNSGRFKIGGDIEIYRLGFGAMRITGKGIWGPPEDRAEVLRPLRRVPELGIDFIDTADSYGPDVSEELIREALSPYDGILIATKAGVRRPGPGVWETDGDPRYLREEAIRSCRKLGVEQIGLWQLHRIDRKVPRDAQFAAVKALLDDGIIAHAGLSEVSVADIKAASEVFFRWRRCRTATTSSIAAARTCSNIASSTGSGSSPVSACRGGACQIRLDLDRVAKAHGATPGQIALAWLLKHSPAMLPIPGTSKVKHLEENVAAVEIKLTDEEYAALDREGRAEYAAA